MDKLKTMKSLSAHLKRQGLKHFIGQMKMEMYCANTDEEIQAVENRFKELKKGG